MGVKAFCVAICSAAIASASCAKDPVDWVNVSIGSISHMLVPAYTTIQRPHSLFRFNAPYGSFTEDEIRTLWIQNPGHRDSPVFGFQPYSGADKDLFGSWRSSWDQPHATPYRYDVLLDTFGVKVSVAPAERSALLSFDFERGDDEVHAVRFSARDGGAGCRWDGVSLQGVDTYRSAKGRSAKTYLFAEFDVPPVQCRRQDGKIALLFGNAPKVVMRIGLSYISIEQAKRNLRNEIGGFDFEGLAADARRVWNDTLSQIQVEGGSEDEKAVFYTALWRCHERMVNITEDGRYYSGFDGKVHESDGVDFYTDDWIWDTFRATHPLMTILAPAAEGAKLNSFVRMAEQDAEGWMPVFPGVAGDRHFMVNRHVAVMFLDAWRKGIRGYDLAKALKQMHHTEETESLIPWYRGPLTELDVFYKSNGFYPGLRPGEEETVQGVHTNWERRQSVSVTQGASYDAWALAEIARELGNHDGLAEKYSERAKWYANLWNPKTEFFHPKDREGRFIEPFDYMLCGGYGARNYYTENNAWTYIWDVQHDLEGLIGLFGGKDAMEAKLDAMFNAHIGPKWKFAGQMPDGCTGMMGVFSMANEPSMHIPYMYNVVGKPWKTQKLVRKTLECWFRNDRMGMCGDEDGGGLSAYAVFSMMGFYPLTPGKPEYEWGSPVFNRVAIRLENGRDFVLEAPDASIDRKYIRSVSVNGERLKDATVPLKHSVIADGGRVRVEMSDRPLRGMSGNERNRKK